MINKCLILLLCLGLTGCASGLGHKYLTMYDSAINTGDITILVQDESYQQLKQRLSKWLTSFGYTKVIFENPGQGFLVLAKEGYVYPCRIILKYRAIAAENKTEIDLVKASDDPETDDQVAEDIREIAALIKE